MERITIEPAENGYILRYDDPEIVKKNRGPGPWVEPEVRKVYPDEASMIQDLSTLLPVLKSTPTASEDAYVEAFDEATRE